MCIGLIVGCIFYVSNTSALYGPYYFDKYRHDITRQNNVLGDNYSGNIVANHQFKDLALPSFTKISVMGSVGRFLKSTGVLYCSGYNLDGLGNSEKYYGETIEPCANPFLRNKRIVDVEVSSDGTFLLQDNHVLYLFKSLRGSESPIQIAHSVLFFSSYKSMMSFFNQNNEILVMQAPYDKVLSVINVAKTGAYILQQGLDATYYISADRKQLYARGNNKYGELGVGSTLKL